MGDEKIKFQILSRDKYEKTLIAFLKEVDQEFAVPLSARVSIESYVEKLFINGWIIGAIEQNKICGICGGYINDWITKYSFITCLVVSQNYRNKGIGKQLFMEFAKLSKNKGMDEIHLSTNKRNRSANILYQNLKMKKLSETFDEIFYSISLAEL